MQCGVVPRILVILAIIFLTSDTRANSLEYDDNDDGSPEESDENNFSFKVNRIVDDDDNEVEVEDDDYYYYNYYDVTPEMQETYKREPYKKLTNWKEGWRSYPLFIIILGGFRWDYLEAYKNLTAFAYLKKHGTSIPFVNTIFPTEDYPVWTTMATGMYIQHQNYYVTSTSSPDLGKKIHG